MTALLAVLVAILAVGYAAWPLLRGREAPPLGDGPDSGQVEAEAEFAALLAWSTAAGELPLGAEAAGPVDGP